MDAVQHDVVSADSHVVEPYDLWQRLVEPRFRERTPQLVHEPDTDRVVCDDARMPPVGMLTAAGRSAEEVRWNGRWDEVSPSGFDPALRLADLAYDGVDGEILYPTLAMQMYPIRDAEFRLALFRAYNTWLAEEFCAPFADRFKGVAVLDPDDVEAAISEVERVARLGLSGVMLPLFSGEDNPYSHPRFNRLWAAAVEHDMPVTLHAATTRDRSKAWEDSTPTDAILSSVGVQRVLLEIVLGGVFDRFPGLRVVSAENEAGWAGSLLQSADHLWHRNRNMTARWGANEFCQAPPSEIFRNNIRLTFMRDRTAILAHEVIGEDVLMWASDFPHNVSTWPASRAVIHSTLGDQTAELRHKVICGNVTSLYGF